MGWFGLRFSVYVLLFALVVSVLGGLVAGGVEDENDWFPRGFGGWDFANINMRWGARFLLYNCSGGCVARYSYDRYNHKWSVVFDVLDRGRASCEVEWVRNETEYWLENRPDPGRFNPFLPPNASYIPWERYNVSVGGVEFHVWYPRPYPDARLFVDELLGFLETHKAQVMGAGAFDNVVEYLGHLLETVYQGYASGYQLIIVPLEKKVYPRGNDYLAILTLDPVPPNLVVPTITAAPKDMNSPKELVFYSNPIKIISKYDIVGSSATWQSGIGFMDWYGREYVVSAKLQPYLWQVTWRYKWPWVKAWTGCMWSHECNAPVNPPSFMLWTTDYKREGAHLFLARKYTAWLQVPLHYSSRNLPVLLRNVLSYPWILGKNTGGASSSGRYQSILVQSFDSGNSSRLLHPDIYILNIEEWTEGRFDVEMPLTVDFLGLRLNATLSLKPYPVRVDGDWRLKVDLFLVFRDPPFLAGSVPLDLAKLLVEEGYLGYYTRDNLTGLLPAGGGWGWDLDFLVKVLGTSDLEEMAGFLAGNDVSLVTEYFPDRKGGVMLRDYRNGTVIVGFGRGGLEPNGSVAVDIFLLVGYYRDKRIGPPEGLVWLGPVARVYLDGGALLRGDLSNALRIVNYYVFNETCLREHGFPDETRYAPKGCLIPLPEEERVPVQPVYHVAGNATGELVYFDKPTRTPINISNATIPLPTTVNGTHTVVNVTANLEIVDYRKIAPLATGAIAVTLATIVLASTLRKKKREEEKKTPVDELENI